MHKADFITSLVLLGLAIYMIVEGVATAGRRRLHRDWWRAGARSGHAGYRYWSPGSHPSVTSHRRRGAPGIRSIRAAVVGEDRGRAVRRGSGDLQFLRRRSRRRRGRGLARPLFASYLPFPVRLRVAFRMAFCT